MQQSWHRKCLLIEAQALLLVAHLALACLSFRRLACWLNHPVQQCQMTQAQRLQHVYEVRWAVALCARSGLCRAVCFPQAITARLMLARRGLAPTVYYGVRQQAGYGWQAHVWVKDRDIPVIGLSMATGYTILLAFPEAESRFSSAGDN